jgi:hypothetical protein
MIQYSVFLILKFILGFGIRILGFVPLVAPEEQQRVGR